VVADAGALLVGADPGSSTGKSLAATAQQAGGLYMSLVAEDYRPRDLPPIDANTLPGESGQLTPYGPQGNQD